MLWRCIPTDLGLLLARLQVSSSHLFAQVQGFSFNKSNHDVVPITIVFGTVLSQQLKFRNGICEVVFSANHEFFATRTADFDALTLTYVLQTKEPD